MKKRKEKLHIEVGIKYYFRDNQSGIIKSGVITKITPKCCMLKLENGEEKRKALRLLFPTIDLAKLTLVKDVNRILEEQFFLNIFELGKLFKEMVDKYPEEFI